MYSVYQCSFYSHEHRRTDGRKPLMTSPVGIRHCRLAFALQREASNPVLSELHRSRTSLNMRGRLFAGDAALPALSRTHVTLSSVPLRSLPSLRTTRAAGIQTACCSYAPAAQHWERHVAVLQHLSYPQQHRASCYCGRCPRTAPGGIGGPLGRCGEPAMKLRR